MLKNLCDWSHLQTRWWTPENLSQNLHVPFSVQLFQKVWTFVRIPWSVWKLATLFQLQDDPRLQPWELLRTTSFHQAYIHDLKAFFSSNMLKCLVSSLCFLAGPLLLSICKALLQQSIHLVATARFSRTCHVFVGAGCEHCFQQPDDIPVPAPGGKRIQTLNAAEVGFAQAVASMLVLKFFGFSRGLHADLFLQRTSTRIFDF